MAVLRTRDRILQTSLGLFNAKGLASVSTHRIAAELGISPGNLHYHFRTKELIVKALFQQFELKLTPCIDAHAKVAALDDLWLSLHFTFEAIDAYRFIYRDVEHLLKEYSSLEGSAQALTARNLLSAKTPMSGLRAADIIRASVEDAEMLALQMVFSMGSWFSFKRLTPSRRGAFAEPSLAAHCTLTLLTPYVEERSRSYLDYLRSKYLR